MKERTALYSLLWNNGLLCTEPCTKEENREFAARDMQQERLPDDVYEIGRSKTYVRVAAQQLTPEEIRQAIALRQLETLKSIRAAVLTAAVFAGLGLLVGILLLCK